MFATLLGALPAPDDDPPGADPVEAAIRAQEAAGLEPVTDGRLADPDFELLTASLLEAARGTPDAVDAAAARVGEAWRHAASLTSRAVKQALPGPYSIGRRAGLDRAATLAVVTALRETVAALAEAGCPLIEIEETEAHQIGEDASQRELFRAAHRVLAEGPLGTHLSLSIVGGSAWAAGLETIIDAPYASLAVDLLAGPDNWNLVTRLPGDRGVIAGVLPARDSPADAKEMLLWAARYAAASRGRGLERVGLGSAGSWANLTWEAAVAKMTRLGEAAELASTPAGERLARRLDPRAVNARTAAMGHPPPRREDR
jgi:methionine synthase II (cobalamin-independent)